MQLPAVHLFSAVALLLAPAVSAGCSADYLRYFCQCVEQTGMDKYAYQQSATQQACGTYSMDHDNAYGFDDNLDLCKSTKAGQPSQKICITEFHQGCPDGTSANCADQSNAFNIVH
ncbi:hypothetical protein EJ03DRAFT_208896 [Teratosphaeria nubilosa]|uniref:Extracellular membrane protein CFEM domain-containing protein n=1 Tax=Teratosphaeria nubilosa TaxID=161662 RepID=A0A6G1KYP6_9PEZI|nr:hypothetical protein EJ03DRAFT_208896 [Teratosphaeria nubilosa]